MTALRDMLSPARGDEPGHLVRRPPASERLLHVGDGLTAAAGERSALVVGADALDVVAAPVGEPSWLDPALVTRTPRSAPLNRWSPDREHKEKRAPPARSSMSSRVVGQPGWNEPTCRRRRAAGYRCAAPLDHGDSMRRLLHDQLAPDVDGGMPHHAG